MRKSNIIVSIAAVLIGAGATIAQPPVQVIIGPDGVKVIDPKTGKEIPSVITKLPHKTPQAIEIELSGLQLQIDKQIERVFQAQLEKKEGKKGGAAKGKDKGDGLEIELKIVPGPDGKPMIAQFQPRPGQPPMGPGAGGMPGMGGGMSGGMNMDKKLDLILWQLLELRQEVDGIKKQLGGGKTTAGPGGPPWQQGFYWRMQPDSPATEKKADKAPTKKTPEAQTELERRFERILREAEALREEIRKMKSKDKE